MDQIWKKKRTSGKWILMTSNSKVLWRTRGYNKEPHLGSAQPWTVLLSINHVWQGESYHMLPSSPEIQVQSTTEVGDLWKLWEAGWHSIQFHSVNLNSIHPVFSECLLPVEHYTRCVENDTLTIHWMSSHFPSNEVRRLQSSLDISNQSSQIVMTE